MTGPSPAPDDSVASVRDRLESLAEAYTEDWDADSPDAATALLGVGARFGSDLRQRVHDAPAKHRLAFFDALGAIQRPPTPARAPVTFDVPADADDVTLPAGTELRTEGGQHFETADSLTATGATLTDVLAVDPDRNALLEHSAVLDGETVSLFEGDDEHRPALLVGDDCLATAAAGSTLHLEAEGKGSPFGSGMQWETYGSDGDTEGWHRLERVDAGDDSCSRARFRLPATPVERTIDGVERRWLRCRPADGAPRPGLSIESLSVAVAAAEPRAPDAMVETDVPVSTDGAVRPFGRHAHPPAAWYVASTPAFTTPGATTEITLRPADDVADDTDRGSEDSETHDGHGGAGTEPPDGTDSSDSPERSALVEATPVLSGPPEVSWEYYNGTGWTRIEGVTDGTDALRTAGTVRFSVPSDLSATAVAGRTEPWVRARLVGGSYGDAPTVRAASVRDGDFPDQADAVTSERAAPRFGGATVTYDDDPQPVDALRRRVGVEWQRTAPGSGAVVHPFPAFSADTRTLYLGFDAPLSGTVTLLSVAPSGERSGGPAFAWEYWDGTWRSADPVDARVGFAEGGIVRLALSGRTAPTERFGRRRHWLRARVTDECVPACEDVRDLDDGGATRLAELHTNAVLAAQVRTVEESHTVDGGPSRTVSCSETPVLEPEVWVEESARLSAADRRRLQSARPDEVEHHTDDNGVTTAVWVQWRETETFAGSGAEDRHYVLDSVAGTITFGDGDHGMAVPAGTGTVRITYRTGGGTAGNVDPGSITALADPVPGVERVSNPVPATGGTDAESTDAVLDRAADRLRHRDRAVTPDDYERLATALGSVGAARCLPEREADTGITVVVAPAGGEPRPEPSGGLRDRVAAELDAAAPARVAETGGVTVRGPDYVPVSVVVTVRASASARKGVRVRLASFLHPTAGNGGDGWPFGTVPGRDTLTAAIESVEGVRSVCDIDAWLASGRARPLDSTSIPSTALICSGEHRVRITGGNTDGA